MDASRLMVGQWHSIAAAMPRLRGSIALLLLCVCAPYVAGCGDDNAEVAPTVSRATATPSPQDPCIPRTLTDDLERRLCAGVYRTPTDDGFDPPIAIELPEPRSGSKWFGGMYSPTDLQIREGRSGCDGCEIGTLEIVLIEGSLATALKEFRQIENLRSLSTRRARILGVAATGVRGRLGAGTGVAFEGLEFGRGRLDASITPLDGRSLVIFVSGNKTFRGDLARAKLKLPGAK